MIILAYFVGGLFAVYLFYALWESALFMRIMDDPVKGKMAAVFSGYVTVSLLSIIIFRADPMVLLYYLLGTLIVGILAYRRGMKLREQPEFIRKRSYGDRPNTIVWFERTVLTLATFTAVTSGAFVIFPYWRQAMSTGSPVNTQISHGDIVTNLSIIFIPSFIMIISAFIVSWGQSRVALFYVRGGYALGAAWSISDFLQSLFSDLTGIAILVNFIMTVLLCAIISLLFSKTVRRWLKHDPGEWDENEYASDFE